MRRPLDGDARRPRRIRLRGHPQWRELFPVLEEIGVEVSVERKLPGIEEAYRDHLRQLREEQRGGDGQADRDRRPKIEAMFPAIAMYVGGYGYVEIGDQEGFGFVVRALGLRRDRLRGRHARHAGRGDGRAGGGAGPVVRGTGPRTHLKSPGPEEPQDDGDETDDHQQQGGEQDQGDRQEAAPGRPHRRDVDRLGVRRSPL